MKRTLWALLVCLSVGCGTTGDGGGGGGDDGDAGGGEDTAALCDSAAAEAVTEYQALDRSCTEDSDCEYRQIGGCGCPVPVNTGADGLGVPRGLVGRRGRVRRVLRGARRADVHEQPRVRVRR